MTTIARGIEEICWVVSGAVFAWGEGMTPLQILLSVLLLLLAPVLVAGGWLTWMDDDDDEIDARAAGDAADARRRSRDGYARAS